MESDFIQEFRRLIEPLNEEDKISLREKLEKCKETIKDQTEPETFEIFGEVTEEIEDEQDENQSQGSCSDDHSHAYTPSLSSQSSFEQTEMLEGEENEVDGVFSFVQEKMKMEKEDLLIYDKLIEILNQS